MVGEPLHNVDNREITVAMNVAVILLLPPPPPLPPALPAAAVATADAPPTPPTVLFSLSLLPSAEE